MIKRSGGVSRWAGYQDFLDAHLDVVAMSRPVPALGSGSAPTGSGINTSPCCSRPRPELDADYLAPALLSPLAAETHAAICEHTDIHRARTGIQTLATLLLTGVGGADRHPEPDGGAGHGAGAVRNVMAARRRGGAK